MLTDAAIRKAKPKAKAYKLADGGGLFLLVTPTGGKWWRFKYRRPVTRRENLLAFSKVLRCLLLMPLCTE